MSIEFYKLTHFISLITATSCLGISYFSSPPQKWAKYLGISASLLLMISGMGLLAKIMPGLAWPSWVNVKIGIWLTVAISGPLMANRLTKFRPIIFSVLMILFVTAIIFAVLKPIL